jgi:hypothetical protein
MNGQSFYRGDPFTYLLKGKLKFNNWVSTILLTIILDAPLLIGIAMSNSFLSTPGRIGLLSDYNMLFFQFTSVPATIYFFLWLSDGIFEVISGLKKNKALVATDEKVNEFINKFGKIYSNWLLVICSTLLIVVFEIFFAIPEHRTFLTWETSSHFVFGYTVFYWSFIFIMGLLLILRGFISLLFFNRLFKNFRIAVKVLHPDGSGGLSPLGTFSTRIGYLIGIYGIISVTTVLYQSYITTGTASGPLLTTDLLFLLIIYLVLAPVAFFAPIGAARSAMKTAKDEFILLISDQFEVETANIRKLISAETETLGKGLKKLGQLQALRKIVSSFPVWPFNVENLIRFFSAISSPFILAAISLIIDLIK